jgi:hypothetical protein
MKHLAEHFFVWILRIALYCGEWNTGKVYGPLIPPRNQMAFVPEHVIISIDALVTVEYQRFVTSFFL